MKKENLFNTTPIKLIRVVKGISSEEMAICFGVTKVYINYVENEERNFRIQTLKYGLDNLGITMEQYNEIVEFRNFLADKQLDDKERYKYMLLKTTGIFTPEMKGQIDEVLNNALASKTK